MRPHLFDRSEKTAAGLALKTVAPSCKDFALGLQLPFVSHRLRLRGLQRLPVLLFIFGMFWSGHFGDVSVVGAMMKSSVFVQGKENTTRDTDALKGVDRCKRTSKNNKAKIETKSASRRDRSLQATHVLQTSKDTEE
jgi:hypothetical protein